MMHRSLVLSVVFLGWTAIWAADPKPEASKPKSSWEGTWQAKGSDHGGTLECTAWEVAGATWKAKFQGYCNRMFVYEIEMTGEKVGSSVVFKGEADLGQKDGGLYTWTGKIEGEKFTGQYETKGTKAGTFEMKLKKSEGTK